MNPEFQQKLRDAGIPEGHIQAMIRIGCTEDTPVEDIFEVLAEELLRKLHIELAHETPRPNNSR